MNSNSNLDVLATVISTQQAIATAKLDLQSIKQLICTRAQQLTRADGAVIEMAEDEKMVYKAATGSAASQLGLALDINKSLSGLSVRTGSILRCDDTSIDDRVDKDACQRVGVASMIVVPLQYEEKSVGALKVLSSAKSHFGTTDLQMLQLLAGIMGAALRNAMIFAANQQLISELQDAIAKVKLLSGLIPICAWCKKIRDDHGYWNQIEKYISEHSNAHFTHSLCPECAVGWREEAKRSMEGKKG